MLPQNVPEYICRGCAQTHLAANSIPGPRIGEEQGRRKKGWKKRENGEKLK